MASSRSPSRDRRYRSQRRSRSRERGSDRGGRDRSQGRRRQGTLERRREGSHERRRSISRSPRRRDSPRDRHWDWDRDRHRSDRSEHDRDRERAPIDRSASSATPSASLAQGGRTPEPDPVAVAAEDKRRRLEAWKAKKAAEAAATGAPGLDGGVGTVPAAAAAAGAGSADGASTQGMDVSAQGGSGGSAAFGAVPSQPPAGVWMPWGNEEQPSAPAQQQQPQPAPSAGVWMPWEDKAAGAPAAVAAAVPGSQAAGSKNYAMPDMIAARKARADAEEAERLEQERAVTNAKIAALAASGQLGGAPAGLGAAPPQEEEEEVDPLDAFMQGTVMPEVKQRAEEEARAKEAERQRQAELMAAGKAPKLINLSDSEEEEPEPDSRLEIPANKVKYVVGPGGTVIQNIQRKSKARIQIQKAEEDLNRAFGSGPSSIELDKMRQQAQQAIDRQQAAIRKTEKMMMPKLKGAEAAGQAQVFKPDIKEKKEKEGEEASSSGDEEPAVGAPPRKMVTLLMYGDAKAIEIAERMIFEAVDNKKQKEKQRAKEYDKKRDEKRRNRQLYHMRHAKDYETLGLPMGSSKADVKKAYRKLAMQWHPDKHPDNQEEAKDKFQKINVAYEKLMTSDEEERVDALAY